MARIINFPHRQAPGNPVGLARSTAFDGRANQARRPSNVRRYISPDELRSLTHDWDASIIEDRPDLYEALRKSSYRLTLGERLVAFGRRYGDALTFWLGMGALALCCTIVASAVMGVGL